MQLQLLQAHQVLGRGNSQSLILSWCRALFVPGQRISLRPSICSLCSTAPPLSRGDLDEEARLSMGAGTTYTCPLCCS